MAAVSRMVARAGCRRMVNLPTFHIFVLIFLACFAATALWITTLSLVKAKGEKAPTTFKPRSGKVLYREVIDGIVGKTDSYIAEIRLVAEDDIRLQIYDMHDRIILETRPSKMLGLSEMVKQYMADVVKKKIESLGDKDG